MTVNRLPASTFPDAPSAACSAADNRPSDGNTGQLVRRELAASYSRYRANALRQLRDTAAAEDVVQAFALKALERADQLRDPLAVHGWLRRLFQTTLIDFCRRSSARRQREIAFDLDLHDRPQDILPADAGDPARAIGAALSCIKREYADAIYRLDLLDQPRESAAVALGISVNNLTVRAHRARRALRDALEVMPISTRGMPGTGATANHPRVMALAAAA